VKTSDKPDAPLQDWQRMPLDTNYERELLQCAREDRAVFLIILVLALLALAISLSGCGGGEVQEQGVIGQAVCIELLPDGREVPCRF
jgi:hypothetical protein